MIVTNFKCQSPDDQIGPSLSSLLLLVETLKARGIDTGVVGEFESRLQSMLDEMRQMAFTLRPAVLDDFGLDSALRQYVNFLRNHTQTRFEYRYVSPYESTRLPVAIEIAFYRIAQEALTNVIRHARAGNVSVIVHHGDHDAQLMVEDDGVGFVANAAEVNGMGMISMRERVTFLGGEFTIESDPGKGTRVRVMVPIAEVAA